MSRVLLLAALPALAACVSAPAERPEPKAVAAAPAPAAAEAADVAADDEDLQRPPPPRRKREYLLTEKDYLGLMRAHPRGFQPDDCLKLCKDDVATAEEGRWKWTLRCALKRNIREEPVVFCREEASDLRPKRKSGGPATVVIADDE